MVVKASSFYIISKSPLFLPTIFRLRFCSLSVPSHDHISRLILEQKTASQSLETFRWASKLSSFTHTQSTYRALVHKLCTFRRFDIVHQLLDEMPSSIGSPPDDSILVTIIRARGRFRMPKEAIKVLDLMPRYGMKPSLKVYNSILDLLVKEDIDIAREFYRQKMMTSGLGGDHYTYGILMKGLCLTNRIGDCFKLLQMMKNHGIKPNTVIYNSLIHALCKNARVGRARSLMSKMEEPNDVTFNILISAYCEEDNLVQALVLLGKSFNMGFMPDVVTVTKLIDILCKASRVAEAFEVLERVESKGGIVDVVAYNNLMKGYCRLGKVKVASRFLKMMERKGCLPNTDTYNALISGYSGCGMLDTAVDIFNDMKTYGISWNIATFDTLIKGLCSHGRVKDAFKILEVMEENKRGNITTYYNIIYGLYKEDRFEEAMEFLSKMGRLFPGSVDKSFKILGLCQEGKMEEAKSIYNEMCGETSVLVYDCLIYAYCENECVREAFEVMDDMISRGYLPIASTFNVVINAFCHRQNDVWSGLKIIKDMVERGGIPDATSYSLVIDALCRNGDFCKALDLLSQMIQKGIVPNPSVWRSLLLHPQTSCLCPNMELLQSITKM